MKLSMSERVAKLQNSSKSHLFQELKNTLIFRWHCGRIDVKLSHLGILCIPSFSSLSIEECHNIQPCKRALRPSRNRACRFPAHGSSSVPSSRDWMGITPSVPLIWPGPTAIPPYFLSSPFRLVGSFFGNGMALPSSAVNRWMTRHGLRPRHVANTLAVIVCSDTGFRVEKPLAQCN